MKSGVTSPIALGGLAAAWCLAGAAFAAKPAPKKPAAPAPKPASAPAPAPMPVPGAAPAPSPEALDFFEKEVRPVLATKCYACHGPKLQQSGLRLDNLQSILRGADGGHIVLKPGNPAGSSLIQVLSHTGAVKMPPAGKLPQKEIDALTQWVQMGAPWPAGEKVVNTADPKKHWAFQPVRNPAIPAVKAKNRVKSPVDAFVLSKLEAKGMTLSAPADRRTLVRRAYFDLIGLPPSVEDVQAFVNDKSPDAFAKVVDKLLAMPQYGERWGRYWLDVARYADSKGYVFQEERRYPFAYTYRDWVVRSLNEDLPYDQFLIQQIAADHLNLGNDKRPLAAMGFMTVGRRFLNAQPDIIDDRMDVLMRGTQGLTLGCARCHDHKFDPIPTKDYYSLYGVFASSHEPKELPLIAEPTRNAEYLAFEKQLNTLEAEVNNFRGATLQSVIKKGKEKIAESLLACRDLDSSRAEVRARAEEIGISPMLLRRWNQFLNQRRNNNPVFAPWFAYSALKDEEFAAQSPALTAKITANQLPGVTLNANVAKLFTGTAPTTIGDVARRYQQILANPPAGDQELTNALTSIGCPLNIEAKDADQFFNRDERNRLQALQQKVDAFRASSPAAPPRAMVLLDNPQPVTPRVFKRGNPNNPGEEVPRHFVSIVAGPEPKPFTQGSGRLELAQAIVDKSNPLTARVMVNRIWLNHFGSPLVRTPSDFGVRSDAPTNPELLDYLATQFMENGWSIKKMHRLMMLSSVYQQASDINPKNVLKDSENTLYWRMNRRRLDFEALRDSVLSTSGKLDTTIGGPAKDIVTAPFVPRRTIYGFIDRQNLPGLFRTFDFASPDTHSPMRFQTTVPQQALFLMNSPFLIEQVRALNERTKSADTAARINALYRLAYARDAAPDEIALAQRFIQSAQEMGSEGAKAEAPVWQFGYGVVNMSIGRVQGFTPLPHFTGQSWQGGPNIPDPKLAYTLLTANGGHPGNDQQHAVIRRWIAPMDGVVTVSGTLTRPEKQGDGVRARVVSSRSGIVGEWTLPNGSVETPVAKVDVKKGDTLDFVVDPLGGPAFDGFGWAPVIRQMMGGSGEWTAQAGFTGPKTAAGTLGPWEKLAQVILLSNEFAFVD